MVAPLEVHPTSKYFLRVLSLNISTQNCQYFEYKNYSSTHFLQLIDGMKDNRSNAFSEDQLHPSGEQEYQEAVEQHHTGGGKKRKKPSSSPSHSNQSMDEIIQVDLPAHLLLT